MILEFPVHPFRKPHLNYCNRKAAREWLRIVREYGKIDNPDHQKIYEWAQEWAA